MKNLKIRQTLLSLIVIFLLTASACKTSNNETVSENISPAETEQAKISPAIPDSVIQYLIASAAQDFKDHTPPTAIDFRNVKAGYFGSDSSMLFLICGEFLAQEKNEWVNFTTLKTSKYEQYIGETMYCHKAILIDDGEKNIAEEIKNKLVELKK